jgi:hypothetical protein
MRPFAITLCLALAAVPAAHAADPPPDDLDALSLADKAPAQPVKPPQKLRLFVEGAVGAGRLLGSDSDFHPTRASLDVRYDDVLTPGLRGVFSDRLDIVRSRGVPPGDDVNTLREAYLSWTVSADRIVDLGRVNIRHGAAFGFNPTDFFKENALRSIVSLDPAVLRENRQGTVVLQGQQLWTTSSLTATVSPKLGTAPSARSYSLNVGATNPRTRWLLAGSHKFGEQLNPEVLLYGGVDTPTQLGFNVSALVGNSTVVFGEFAAGKDRRLIAKALSLPEAEQSQRRGSIGLTYTTGFNLSLTVEAEHNSAGPNRAEWDALPALAPNAQLGVLAAAQALQDLPARNAWFVHATWRDLLVRRLDVSGFVRREAETSSRAQWLEARYRWDRAEVALQWQIFSGAAGSVFGTVPQRRLLELAVRIYL